MTKSLNEKLATLQNELRSIVAHLEAGNIIPAIDCTMVCHGYNANYLIEEARKHVLHESVIETAVTLTTNLYTTQIVLQHPAMSERNIRLAISFVRKCQVAVDEMLLKMTILN